MPSRRRLVASLGAALTGLAGCLDTSSDSTPPTAEATLGDSISLDGTTVTATELAAVHSYHYLSAPDAFGVESAGSDRFLFVALTASGERPPPGRAFALDVGGDRLAFPEAAPAPERDLAPVGDGRYTEESPQGYLVFRVPAPLETSVAVTLRQASQVSDSRVDDDARARWSIPDARLDALRSPPPEFAVSYDVPESVDANDPIPVGIDVTNKGDGSGVCRGAINHTHPMHGGDSFSLSLDSGASTTYEMTVDYHVDDRVDADSLEFDLLVPGDARSFTVTLEGAA
ncbi:hypothetical protein SAMN04488065_1142 [Haloplanus vescus]|uniref:Uncharacterized protein n=1 Tax=Haloplanus vescus TaxID=555874 RepID=A0A1H3WTZ7_9EURY|nr:hypothetical protein [Haloplanus vescus]SDZ90625.1 hypothetical protein SAMN04488065_1142 [Haloplanus vescus]